jgi:hypothetical protein
MAARYLAHLFRLFADLGKINLLVRSEKGHYLIWLNFRSLLQDAEAEERRFAGYRLSFHNLVSLALKKPAKVIHIRVARNVPTLLEGDFHSAGMAATRRLSLVNFVHGNLAGNISFLVANVVGSIRTVPQ